METTKEKAFLDELKRKYPALHIGEKALAFWDKYLRDAGWLTEYELVYIQYHCIAPYEEGKKTKEEAARHLQWLYSPSIGKEHIHDIEDLLAA